MSQNRKSWVVATLTAFFAMVLSTLVSIPAASANSADPPPVPTVLDRSGADQDEFVIPDNPDWMYFGSASSNSSLSPGFQSSGGALTYTVKTAYYNAEGVYTDGPSYVLTFSHATVAEAHNGFTLALGSCNTRTGRTALTVYLQNPADSSGRYLPTGELEVYNIDGAGGSMLTPRVLDGSTVAIEFVPGSVGIFPGTNSIRYFAGNTLVKSDKIWVPACGRYEPPDGDPGQPGGPDDTASRRMPTGFLRVVNCRRSVVKAVMNNRRTSVKAVYWLTVDRPRYGGKTTKRFVVKAGVKKIVKRDLVAGTRVILKVTKPGTTKRKRLDVLKTASTCSS